MVAAIETLRTAEAYLPPDTYIDNYRPCDFAETFESIPFEDHIDAGRTVVMLDAEGTFVRQDGWIVDESVKQRLEEARQYAEEKGQPLHIFVVTNKRPHSENDLVQMQAWAEQIGAEQLFTPLEPGQGKPSPHMLLKVMEFMEKYHPEENLTHENYMMVDDKLSAGIAAANFIGVHSTYVARRGETDLVGDRFRRILERVFFERYGTRDSPADPTPSEQHYAEKYSPKSATTPEVFILPDGHSGRTLINGYGALTPTIQINDLKRGQLRPSPIAPITGPLRETFRSVDSTLFENDFIVEYGDVLGDLLTDVRPQIMAEAAKAIEQGDKKTAFVLYAVAWITDFLDGKCVRASRRGPSEEGARNDYLNDKSSADLIGQAMVEAGIMPRWAQTAIKSREVLRKLQRQSAEKEGLDTSATSGGKSSTIIEATVGGYALLEEDKTNRDLAFMLMVVAKFGSLATGMAEWRIKDLKKQFANEMRRHAAENGNLQSPSINIKVPDRITRRRKLPRGVLPLLGETRERAS